MQGTSARRYDIDALRVIAFALLIFYHVGMFYVTDWDWHIKSAYLAEWLQYPMMVVNRWRMPLLFMVSGLAVNFLLRNTSAGGFAFSRFKRLLIPLLFGMAVVVPPQAYLQAVSNSAFAGSYGEFLSAYFAFQPWPADAFDGSHVGVTWNHLWYLPYLLTYSLLLAALLPLLHSKAGTWLRDRFRSLRGLKLALLPAVPLVLYAWLMSFPSTHDLVTDWENHAKYFTVFLYGYWMGADAGLWDELNRLRWKMLVAASVFLVAFLALAYLRTPSSPDTFTATYDLFEYFYQWAALLAIFGWSYRLLNRPWRWLGYATEAVYPWYILHQTITVIAGYQLAKLSLGPVIEPLLVLIATIGGCLLLHEFVIRRVNFLRPLFGLKHVIVTASARTRRPDEPGVIAKPAVERGIRAEDG